MSFKLSVPVCWWTDFCDPDLLSLITHTTRENEANFVPTTVSTGVADYRHSLVLWHHHYEELHRRFTNRLEQVIPTVRDQMGDYAPSAPHTKLEVQLTVHHRNGDHFKKHIDNGSADTASRRLTYVYYYRLSHEQNFEGGELLIYLQNGIKKVLPQHNTIIWFPSHLYHEVIPVTSKTEKFEDGRFTLNGWLHV